MKKTKCPRLDGSPHWKHLFQPASIDGLAHHDTGELSKGEGVEPPAKEMAKAGDVVGLLNLVRRTEHSMWPDDIMSLINRAIHVLAERDVALLSSIAIGQVLGFSFLMWSRVVLHIQKRLAECDAVPGDRTHLPVDLEHEGWLQRAERISRFMAEMTAVRARSIHVCTLNNYGQAKERRRTKPAKVEARKPVDRRLYEAQQAPPAPDPTLLSSPAKPFAFP